MQRYYCELCDIHFATAQALGGHVGNSKMHARLKEQESTSENTKVTASRLQIRGQAQPAGVAAASTACGRRREKGLPKKEALPRAVAGWKSLSLAEKQNW